MSMRQNVFSTIGSKIIQPLTNMAKSMWYMRLDTFIYYYYVLNNFTNFIISLLKRKNVSFVALVRDNDRLLTNTSSFSFLAQLCRNIRIYDSLYTTAVKGRSYVHQAWRIVIARAFERYVLSSGERQRTSHSFFSRWLIFYILRAI